MDAWQQCYCCSCIVVDVEMRELCRFAPFHGFWATPALNSCASHRSFSTRKLSVNAVESNQREFYYLTL
jgi:hypothetical protein